MKAKKGKITLFNRGAIQEGSAINGVACPGHDGDVFFFFMQAVELFHHGKKTAAQSL